LLKPNDMPTQRDIADNPSEMAILSQNVGAGKKSFERYSHVVLYSPGFAIMLQFLETYDLDSANLIKQYISSCTKQSPDTSYTKAIAYRPQLFARVEFPAI